MVANTSGAFEIKTPVSMGIKKLAYIILQSMLICVFLSAQGSDFLTKVMDMEDFRLTESFELLFPYSVISPFILFGVALTVYISYHFDSAHVCEKVASVLFSLFMLTGYCVKATGSFAENLYSMRFLLFSALIFIGGVFAFLAAFRFLPALCRYIASGSHSLKLSAKFLAHPFRNQVLLTLICWLPYIVLRYPAGLEYDGYHQIARFMSGNLTAHWPPASSAWMGIYVLLGDKLLHSTNIGIFMYVLTQAVISAVIFAYCTDTMKSLQFPGFWVTLSIFAFALIPIYPGYVTSVVKDSPFSVMVLLFVCLLCRILILGDTGRLLIATFFTAFAMTILRNNGIHILVVCLVASFFLIRGKKSFLFAPLLAATLLYFVYSGVCLPALGIRPGSEAEALSVPFQQTARVVSRHSSELSEDDIAAIGAVLDYDNLESDYDPFLSDPVKKNYHAEGDALSKYLKSWFGLLIKYPAEYVDAFLSTGIGFYYPDIRMGTPDATSGVYTMLWNDKDVVFTEPSTLSMIKPYTKAFVRFVEDIPLVYPFVNIAIQMWIPIYLFFVSIKRKDGKLLFLLLPSLLGILVCLAGPTYTNNGGRYALPIVYCNMLLIGLALKPSLKAK